MRNAEGHRFAHGGDMNAGQELIDGLHGRARPGMIAKPMHGFSHRFQQRIGGGKGIGTARSHDRKPPVGRLDGAAGNGRVQIKDAAVSCGGFHFDCEPRRNRCAGNDHGSWLQP